VEVAAQGRSRLSGVGCWRQAGQRGGAGAARGSGLLVLPAVTWAKEEDGGAAGCLRAAVWGRLVPGGALSREEREKGEKGEGRRNEV
jgi:hypothetical protein